MTEDYQVLQIKKAIPYSLIWATLWGIKNFLIGGSPFLLLISTSIVFFAIYKKKKK
jgi:hypothetical protein